MQFYTQPRKFYWGINLNAPVDLRLIRVKWVSRNVYPWYTFVLCHSRKSLLGRSSTDSGSITNWRPWNV
jgi:hypothetical protein